MKIFNYIFLKKSVGGYIENKSPVFFEQLNRHKTGVKYVFSGGTGALVNLALLYALTELAGVWYLTSSIIAFIVSLLVGFFLQKFWTFRDPALHRIRKQFIIYVIMGAMNFFVGPALLYVFVEFFHVWYIFGQVLAMAILATVNYLINKFVTFKKDTSHEGINV